MSLLRVFSFAGKTAKNRGLLVESVLTACSRTAGYAASGVTKDKEPLRKAKTPQGRFDMDEKDTKNKDVLESISQYLQTLVEVKPKARKIYAKDPDNLTGQFVSEFPDDVNPETKEKGGPRGPEPTRYGDWERKGRCIDF